MQEYRREKHSLSSYKDFYENTTNIYEYNLIGDSDYIHVKNRDNLYKY